MLSFFNWYLQDQVFSENDAFFAWAFVKRRPLWQTLLSFFWPVLTLAICLFPVYPHWAKLLILYTCAGLLLLILCLLFSKYLLLVTLFFSHLLFNFLFFVLSCMMHCDMATLNLKALQLMAKMTYGGLVLWFSKLIGFFNHEVLYWLRTLIMTASQFWTHSS